MSTIAATALSLAVLVSSALHIPNGGLLLFGGWCMTLAVALRFGPAIWRSELEFVVTDSHVMWKRGRIRRTIERGAISFARIQWHPTITGVGDLELVRAVPTGALRRRLAVRMPDIVAPDRIWAIIRGVPTPGGAGEGERPLSQRMDDDEQVVWSARPRLGWRAWLPHGMREALTAVTAALVAIAFVREIRLAFPATRHVLAAGVAVRSVAFAALLLAVALTAALLAGVAIGLFYAAVVRPARLAIATRYLITDKRVLIQRGREELHLDRGRIVDVIDTPLGAGLHDLFLVLDGPRARALAASGAFGERGGDEGLVPVLHAVENAEEVSRILRLGPTSVETVVDDNDGPTSGDGPSSDDHVARSA
jgi:hypothetical protein